MCCNNYDNNNNKNHLSTTSKGIFQTTPPCIFFWLIRLVATDKNIRNPRKYFYNVQHKSNVENVSIFIRCFCLCKMKTRYFGKIINCFLGFFWTWRLKINLGKQDQFVLLWMIRWIGSPWSIPLYSTTSHSKLK